jgi:hypothetical protein
LLVTSVKTHLLHQMIYWHTTRLTLERNRRVTIPMKKKEWTHHYNRSNE